METQTLTARAFGAAAAVALLAGCDGGTSPALNDAVVNAQAIAKQRGTFVAQRRVSSVRPDRHASWMRRGAKANALLYVSDPGTDDVYVYAYPQLTPAGALTGFDEPQGLCSDKAGDVYVTNTQSSQIFEYAHGGTSPIETLSDPGQYPVACSVNGKTGDLAVSNVFTTSFGPGSVSVYKHAEGTPTNYSDPSFFAVYFLSYDAGGNLFVDGNNAGTGTFQYAELAKGSRTFADITLTQSIGAPGGVQYASGSVAVGDQSSSVIYRTSGATVIGSTALAGASDVGQFFILGNRVICPDAGNADVAIYRYPAGGTPVGTIAGLHVPVGATVSR